MQQPRTRQKASSVSSVIDRAPVSEAGVTCVIRSHRHVLNQGKEPADSSLTRIFHEDAVQINGVLSLGAFRDIAVRSSCKVRGARMTSPATHCRRTRADPPRHAVRM